MSFGLSFGGNKSKSTTNSSGVTDPWRATVPYLQDFLGKLGQNSTIGETQGQKDAYAALRANASAGNPNAGAIGDAAATALGAKDYTGGVSDALSSLKGQLGDYASGKFLDVANNPQLKALMDQVATQTRDSINAGFAGAGRDMSGANSQTAARGITQATAPLLLDQFNKQQDKQIAAAQGLYGAATGAATTSSGLDAARAALQKSGVDLSKEAMAARDRGANTLIALDQQEKQLPLQDLGLLASILFPAAGLGSSTQGTSTTNTKSSGVGFSLSDARAKQNAQSIGELADGTPVYRWQYKGDDEWHVGPMAQDVERRHPEAVATDPSTGLKYVNLDMATRRAAELAGA